MAILQLDNGNTYQAASEIDPELAALNLQLQRWPVGDHPELLALLAAEQCDEQQQNLVLQHLSHYFQQLQARGYQSCDLMVIDPATPDLDKSMAKFQHPHTHADDEVRYVIAGAGVFGFVRPDGSQIELTVQAGEYIQVPAGTEHWFHLDTNRMIKAVRYFRDTAGWTPQYTTTTRRF